MKILNKTILNSLKYSLVHSIRNVSIFLAICIKIFVRYATDW